MRTCLFFLFLLLINSALFSDQKVVVISGANSGIGLATAKVFQEKGWKVWAGFHKQVSEELQHVVNIKLCHLDVTDDLVIQKTIEAILKEDGKIDALINNAGYGLIGAEECVTIEEAQQLFDVNFFGMLRLTQAVLPTMRQQRSGHIINISSGLGLNALPGLGLYSASKFALEGLCESLAATLSPWNIKVAIIEPGFVKNNCGKHCLLGSRPCNEEAYSQLTQGICKMLGTPRGQPCEEVASLIVEIAETAQSNLRYQTTANMKEYVAEILVDPTGNEMQKRNIQFLNSIISNQ
jgi:NAD(P)-dependent dehydrogenase (short-subunit alcohol dehydrogenase family)